MDIEPKLNQYEKGQLVEIYGINFGNSTDDLDEVSIDNVIIKIIFLFNYNIPDFM